MGVQIFLAHLLSALLSFPLLQFKRGLSLTNSRRNVAGKARLCFSLAILSPLDTDWTASHSHSGISVWTVMSKIHEMPANYCLSPSLGIFPSTLSQCVCASNMKILRSSSFNVFYPTIPFYSVKLLPALSPHKPLYVVVASRRRMRSLCSQ